MLMEFLVIFILGLAAGTGCSFIFFPRVKLKYVDKIDASTLPNPNQKPRHSVIVYITDNRNYTDFAANIDGVLSIAERSLIEYGLRDLIVSHYLLTYNEALSDDVKDYVKAVAVTHRTALVKASKAEYCISFQICHDIYSLDLADRIVSTQG